MNWGILGLCTTVVLFTAFAAVCFCETGKVASPFAKGMNIFVGLLCAALAAALLYFVIERLYI